MGRSLPKSVNTDWIQELCASLVIWSTFMAVDWCPSSRLPIQAESIVQSQGNSFLIWGGVPELRQTDRVIWVSTPVCPVSDGSLAVLFIEDSGFQILWFDILKCRSVCLSHLSNRAAKMGAPEEKNYRLTVHLTALCGISAFLTFVGAQWQFFITGRSTADYKIKPHHSGSYLQLLFLWD